MYPLFYRNFENFKFLHFYVSKNYEIKYIDIDIYTRSVCKKSLLKKYIVFWEI
jgi:hypothetical protein